MVCRVAYRDTFAQKFPMERNKLNKKSPEVKFLTKPEPKEDKPSVISS